MEIMAGGSLADRLNAQRHITADKLAIWLDQLTDALEYAHKRGVVHGGLKPTSIVFDSSERACVTDFAMVSRAGEKSTRAFLGAPDFVAPEQWDGLEPTPASDQYSLAVIAYLALTSCRPFERQMDPEMRQKNFSRGPIPAHEQARRTDRPDLTSTVSAVLCRAMSVECGDRYPSIRNFSFAFQHAVTSTTVRPTGTPRVFISYRRSPSAAWANLIGQGLKRKHRISSFIDTDQVDTAVQISAKVQQAILESDVFVCLLASSTLRSKWVEEEIRFAWQNGKPMVPVFHQGFRPVKSPKSEQPAPHIQDLLGWEGVHLFDRLNIHIDKTIEDLARIVRHEFAKASRSQ